MSETHVYGIRHHGPGSARSLLAALEARPPDVVLIEGPPDAEDLLPLAIDPAMKPPVAILIYGQKQQKDAVFYPFAEFSPEWQAIRWALAAKVPLRFIDLPVTHHFALDAERGPRKRSKAESDPLDLLAKAAGYGDGERWWNRLIEERRDPEGVFEAIAEVMTSARRVSDPILTDESPSAHRERLREAHMRRSIRRAEKEGFQRLAVVVGAWHVPALLDRPTAKSDDALLKGLPKTKVEATWIPWTHGRLTFSSGYGAGVDSPGWYQHLWSSRDQPSVRWMTRVARLLREAGVDASSAQVIDAVRLADTLAALRDRPMAGLDELSEATRAVLLFGDDLQMKLVQRQLIVGEALGEVPESTPRVPLVADLAAEQKRLRMPAEAGARELVLDLRSDYDRARSQLLRRLQLLGVDWGEGGDRAEGRGTFKEAWVLEWVPEHALSLIEASTWGTTIERASTARAIDTAERADLPALTRLARQVLLADLPEAVERIMQQLEARAALAADITHLLEALPDLAQLFRYGDVRGTEGAVVEHVLAGLIARASVGLPNAVAGLGPEAAEQLLKEIEAAHGAIGLLDREAWTEAWRSALRAAADRSGAAAIIAGRAARLLLQAGVLDRAEAGRRLSQALSPGTAAPEAAAWIEGFLRGSGQVLIHDPELLELIDHWVGSLDGDSFVEQLPILRRTFSTFAPSERRSIGQQITEGTAKKTEAGARGVDLERAGAVLPLVALFLGLGEPQEARDE